MQLLSSSSLPPNCDALIAVYSNAKSLQNIPELFPKNVLEVISNQAAIDDTVHKQTHLFSDNRVKRLILSPVGPLDRDYDDVRRYYDASRSAIKRAKAAGARNPALVVIPPGAESVADLGEYQQSVNVALLGVFQELHRPLEVREWMAKTKSAAPSIETIHLLSAAGLKPVDLQYLEALEMGREIARDIITTDPERMAPQMAAQYITQAFSGQDGVKVTTISDLKELQANYPLLMAVARASLDGADKHWPVVVKLEYKAPAPRRHLYLTGKGITYDTGGADLKTGGAMRGMSRDKGGAAALAGFMRVVAEVKPKDVSCSVSLAFVRNSIGPNSYVSDEIIVSRAGKRVLIGNTDAEGRMVMADLLAEHKEQAEEELKNTGNQVHLFTCATLTGHVIRAYGPYPACVDNGPARRLGTSKRLAEVGALWGEPWEISTLRREDYAMVAANSDREDCVQCNTAPSTMTPRGHQFPAAFMATAAGMEANGRSVPYTHLDIAGAAEEDGSSSGSLARCTGAPVVSLCATYLL